MNKLFITITVALVCHVTSVAAAQDEAKTQNFLKQTEEQIFQTLQTHAQQAGDEGKDLLEYIQHSTKKRKDIQWKPEAPETFEKVTFAPDTPFSYVYATRYQEYIVNKDAFAALFQLEPKSKELGRETLEMLRELTRAMGEQIIRQRCGDFRSYWCRGDWRKGIRKPSAHHLYDAEGRVNPVALYGLYMEYVLWKRPDSSPEDADFHSFIKKLAEHRSEYKQLAEEVEKYYPAGGAPLHRMLEYEASWSACWVMAKKALFIYCENDKDAEEDGKKLTDIVNKHVQKLTEGPLPDAQKNYIHQKYQMNNLTQGTDVPAEMLQKMEQKATAVAITVPKSAKEAKQIAERKKRQERARQLGEAYADYLALLGDDKVWNIESSAGVKLDKKLKKLIVSTRIQLSYALIEQYKELLDLIDTVQDNASAESKIPEIVRIGMDMNKTSRLHRSMGFEFTFHYNAFIQEESREFAINHKELLQECAILKARASELSKRLKKSNYFGSRNFEQLIRNFDKNQHIEKDDIWKDPTFVMKDLYTYFELSLLSGAF